MENENKKRKILLLITGILIVLIATIGASYSFFSANINGVGSGDVKVNTAVLVSATMDFGDKVVANGIYPGNKIIKTLEVKGSGPENAVPIKATISFTPNVEDFGNHVKYSLYAVENSTIDKNKICEETKPTIENGKYFDAMKCETIELGDPIITGIFKGKNVVTKEIEVTSTTNTTYYLIIEYLNDENAQNKEQGKTFTVNIGFHSEYEKPRMRYDFKLEGEETVNLPNKASYYDVSVSCSDGIEREWNKESWSLEVDEVEEDITCTIEFSKNYESYIASKGEETGEVAYDGTSDNNLRFIGSNPSNYVNFNGELWRIIGFMNNIEDENGNKETRIKIRRNTRLLNQPLNKGASSSSNKTDWSKSATKIYLNDIYYEGLTDETKNMVDNAVWHLGGFKKVAVENSSKGTGYLPSKYYSLERGTAVYNGNPSKWTGKIGLIYISDFLLAVGGSYRDTCLKTAAAFSWGKNNCNKESWLISTNGQWTIIPTSDNVSYAYKIQGTSDGSNRGIGANLVASVNLDVFPTLYLKSDIKITGGEGKITDPYLLEMKN